MIDYFALKAFLKAFWNMFKFKSSLWWTRCKF